MDDKRIGLSCYHGRGSAHRLGSKAYNSTHKKQDFNDSIGQSHSKGYHSACLSQNL